MDTATIDAPRESQIETRLFGHADTPIETPALISAMLDSDKGISDLIFSPGRPPQVERYGVLVPVQIDRLEQLTPEHTARIARDLIGGNVQALNALETEGAADFSYALPARARFRVNAFRQRGSFAIVMRVIAS